LKFNLQAYDQFPDANLHRRYNVVCAEVGIYQFVLDTLENALVEV
jgi:hypothetical protein